jgi:hypothetical protein
MRALHTPQQETNSAYNPGVSYRGGEFMAQGISQAGNAITAGFQRYAANKEENSALDTRFEGTAKPLMEKLKLYGELADENSPAAGLLDKAADWHKLGTSQKKVLLADMLLLGDKSEAAQRRKEAEQYQLLDRQDRQAQFAEVQKQHQIANDRNWKNDALAALDRHQQNMRGIEADRRADKRLSMDETAYADTVGRLGRQDQEAVALRGAVGGFVRDFNQFAEGPQFNGTGMQRPMGQFEAYRRALGANPRAVTPQMMDDLGRMAVSEDRLSQSALSSFAPTLGTKSVTLANGQVIEIPFGTTSAGGVHWMPQTLTQFGGKAPVPTVSITTTDANGNKVTRKLTAAEADALPAPVPNDIQKQIADLRKAIAKDEGDIGAGDSRLWYGGSRSERLKENRAMLDALERNYGGAKPAAAPAAAAATPQSKAQRANALAAQNPGWTREQVIEAVNRETSR